MTDRVVQARWWVVIALLLGIQGDVAPLAHESWSHGVYAGASIAAWVMVAVAIARRDA